MRNDHRVIQSVPDVPPKITLPKEYIRWKLEQEGHANAPAPIRIKSAEDLARLKKSLQDKEPQRELPFRVDSKGEIPTSNPESHEIKRSPILEQSKDPDYFLESINEKLEGIWNEIAETSKSFDRKMTELKGELASTKRMMRIALKASVLTRKGR